MLELFIALFGGLYLLGKYSSEKAAIYNNSKEHAIQKVREDALVNEVFEIELAKKIANVQYQAEIKSILKDDLQYIYGDCWPDLFDGYWNQPNIYHHPCSTCENVILTLMLSKSGLIPRYCRIPGTGISNFSSANAYECLKILHCVETNIKKKTNYTDMQLLFIPRVIYQTPPKKYDLGTPDFAHPCSGKFQWYFGNLLIKPRYFLDIRSEKLVDACKKASAGDRSLKSTPYNDTLFL